MAKISAILNEQLIMIITKWLQEVKNPEAKCIKITVLKTKGEVKAEYKFHDKSIDTKYVLFTFEDIKKYSGLDLSRILAIEAIEQKKKQREELEKKKAHNQIIIQNLKKKGRTDLDEDYISISQTGHRKRKGTLASALKRTCNQAGIRRISLHSLRHHFATMLLEQDMPLETISKLLGHKNVLTTFNIYVGIIDANEDTSKALDTLLPMVTEG